MGISESSGAAGRLGGRFFWSLAAALAFVAYCIVLLMAGASSVSSAAVSSLRNLLPLAILTAVVQPLLSNHVVRWQAGRALAAHIVVSLAFAILWYWLLMVLIGLSAGDSPLRFSVRPFFPDRAVAWQLLQGITVYALLAATAYFRAQPAMPSFIVADPATEPSSMAQSLSRYFIRQGDDIHPVNVSHIVSITGADDYAEVSTLSGKHLVRMTLADFEKVLEDGSFIRVHRSRIVNLDRLERAEPAGGGRMLLHMENGEMIQASRSGTKLLRERVI